LAGGDYRELKGVTCMKKYLIRKFILDFLVEFTVYFATIALTLNLSEKYSFPSFFLLPSWTLILVVIYSQNFAITANKFGKESYRLHFITQ
jgi:hypothetical protein